MSGTTSNQPAPQAGEAITTSKKDKRRQTIQTKLKKLSDNFEYDKDYHYRNVLQVLQKELTTVHNEANPQVSSEIQDFEETRDYELVSLKLFRDFEAGNADTEFYEEVSKANKEHDDMVKAVKEKLYAKLEHQIKQLKEDKVLLDMANSHSYSMIDAGEYHKNTRSVTHNAMESTLNPLSGLFGSMDRRPTRRRNAPTDYYSAQNEDSMNESSRNGGYTTPNGSNSTNSRNKKKKISNHGAGSHTDGATSNDEGLFSDTGDLSSLLLGDRDKKKPSTRGSNKSYVSPQGIKTEEVNEDLDLINKLCGNETKNL
ncbi:hypothetical protein WICPIJ_009167 [Wickerhamomyces pijperi]|uniref:Uncharacterized protein n=1 Tax=Wickerhamomyces pijperi TaxID=599730 RepID=A0A9P8PQH4_WICPI|nr:hypothetical protein WICPIJ_009167 [Wickerhamomyces pijperi]